MLIKKVFVLFILALTLMSCSTLKKTMITSAIVGGTIGGVGGAIFSPNKESVNKNAFVFSLLGASVAALGGYLLHDSPSDQEPRKNMLLDSDKDVKKIEDVPLLDFSPELKNIKPEINIKAVKKYEVPQEKLPEELKGKVKKQYIMEYQSEPRTIQVGNKTIQIDSFKAWEASYEE